MPDRLFAQPPSGRTKRDVQAATVRSTELEVINVNSLSVDSYQKNSAHQMRSTNTSKQLTRALHGLPIEINKPERRSRYRLSTGITIKHTVLFRHQPIPERLFWIFAVVAIHVLVVLMMCDAFKYSPARTSADETFVALFIQPKIRDQGAATEPVDLSRLVMRVQTPLANLHIEQPEIIFDVSRDNAATSAAPTLQESGQRDIKPFIKQAALLPGEGVTVVLRVEVLESGDPGRIEIDASSGSEQVDQAALDYARTRHWYAGRVDGTPHPMWIRWGVRLQA